MKAADALRMEGDAARHGRAAASDLAAGLSRGVREAADRAEGAALAHQAAALAPGLAAAMRDALADAVAAGWLAELREEGRDMPQVQIDAQPLDRASAALVLVHGHSLGQLADNRARLWAFGATGLAGEQEGTAAGLWFLLEQSQTAMVAEVEEAWVAGQGAARRALAAALARAARASEVAGDG